MLIPFAQLYYVFGSCLLLTFLKFLLFLTMRLIHNLKYFYLFISAKYPSTTKVFFGFTFWIMDIKHQLNNPFPTSQYFFITLLFMLLQQKHSGRKAINGIPEHMYLMIFNSTYGLCYLAVWFFQLKFHLHFVQF